jgi:hypothetical protein
MSQAVIRRGIMPQRAVSHVENRQGVIRMERGRTPIGTGGTFSNNGYDLGTPTPVVSYVQRAVPNPSPMRHIHSGQFVPMTMIPGHTHGMHSNPSVSRDLGDAGSGGGGSKTWMWAAGGLALLGAGAAAYWLMRSK